MQFCSSAGSVLILLLMIFITGSESAVSVVKVKYGGTAVLPCTERCTGVVSWTPSHKSTDILADCDQTKCRSVKEGYQMIYNQYLQGDLSLTISKADYSKRGRYTCDCDYTDKCDVELQIETLRISIQMKPGDSLLMKLDVSDPVEVIYYSTGSGDGSSGQICTVIGGSLQCNSNYKRRTSLLSSSVLVLREMEESDSGVYIIRTIRNKEDLHIYTVTIATKGSESAAPVVVVEYNGAAVLPCTDKCSGVVRWTLFHKPTETLAECDQTSCRSVKEGYQMIYNQYLQGNLSLIISKADFSKTGWYTSDCDGKDHCKVYLLIKTLRTSVQIQPGESLVMVVSDPVEVNYHRTGAADGSSNKVCKVIGGSLQSEPEYKNRTSLLSSSVLELRGVMESDRGVYTIHDTKNNQDLYIYRVNVMTEVVPIVRVDFNGTAVLSCNKSCTENRVVSWTPTDTPSNHLAECEKNSCRSVKKGYQMIHDQYLKGNLSLIIPVADYSKKAQYTCDCGGRDLCHVHLLIEPPIIPVQIQSGDSLLMELEVSDPVEVIYNSKGSADGSGNHICTADKGSLQCKPEYEHRTSLLSSSVLKLRDMKGSDRGVYTIQGTKNKENIHIYTVTVAAPIIPIQIQSGDSLQMELDESDPVEVIYNSAGSADGSGNHICTVNKGSLQCKPEYKHRTSLLSSSVLELRDMKGSDSGVYTIQGTKNKEDIHIYSVTVTESRRGLITAIVLLVILGLVVVCLSVWFCKKCKKNKKLKIMIKELNLQLTLNMEANEHVDFEENVLPSDFKCGLGGPHLPEDLVSDNDNSTSSPVTDLT